MLRIEQTAAAVWPDLAKFRHFGKTLQVFVKFWTVYFLFGKMFTLLWQIWYFIALIFIVVNGQILKNNLTIWSHWAAAGFVKFLKHKFFSKDPSFTEIYVDWIVRTAVVPTGQLMWDEGSYLPKWKAVVFMKCQNNRDSTWKVITKSVW